MGLGKLYADVALIILPDFLLNSVSHLLILGVVTGFLLPPMENKLIWGRFF